MRALPRLSLTNSTKVLEFTQITSVRSYRPLYKELTLALNTNRALQSTGLTSSPSTLFTSVCRSALQSKSSLKPGVFSSVKSIRLHSSVNSSAMVASETEQMKDVLAGLQPAGLWKFFGELAAIPRPSKHEEKWDSHLTLSMPRMSSECSRGFFGRWSTQKIGLEVYSEFCILWKVNLEMYSTVRCRPLPKLLLNSQ